MNSAEKVESTDGILMDILNRLRDKSVLRFMCVSKRWNNIISDPFFFIHHHHSSRASAIGGTGGRRLLTLIERDYSHGDPPNTCPMNVLPIIDHHHGLPGNLTIKKVPEFLGYFINSSNGLILCGRPPCQYHVLNPVSKRWATLPIPSHPKLDDYDFGSIGLMCEENTTELSANYTVVIAAMHADNNTMKIQTYSSRTREWVTKLLAAGNFCLLRLRRPPVVANGVFHWYSAQQWNVIAVYDPKDDESRVQLIELPVTKEHYPDYVSHTVTRSPVDDTLWYGMITRTSLRFFMLPKGDDGNYKRARSTTIPRGEWVLMDCVGVDSLCKDAGLQPAGQVRKNLRKTRVIFLEYFLPWNPLVALLRQGSRVFLYNLGSKSVEELRFYGNTHNYGYGFELTCPYLQSPFLSSYRL